MNEDLDKYLDKMARRNEAILRETVVQAATKPEFEQVEKLISLPSDVWMNRQFGHIWDLIEYLRDQNDIPRIAHVQIQMESPNNALILRFTWWEAKVLLDENLRL